MSNLSLQIQWFDTPLSETIYRIGRSVADEMVAQPTIYFSVVSGRGELCAGSIAREEGSSGANVDFWKETCNAECGCYATKYNQMGALQHLPHAFGGAHLPAITSSKSEK